MTDENLDHRRTDRLLVRIEAQLSTLDPDIDPATGTSAFRSSRETIANLSIGGAFVETPETLAPGRRVLLDMALPDGALVETIGRVAWSRARLTPEGMAPDSGIGIEFVGAAREHFERLNSFLVSARQRALTAERETPATARPSRQPSPSR